VKILTKADSQSISAAIVNTLKKYNLSEENRLRALRYLRVSKAGNIILCDRPIITGRLLEQYGAKSKNDVECLLKCLTEKAARKIISWVDEIGRGGASLAGELTPEDFNLETELSQHDREMMLVKFSSVHENHSRSIEEKLVKLYAGLEIETAPKKILNQINCAFDRIEVTRKGFGFVIKCGCGLKVEVDGQLRQFKPLDVDWDKLSAEVINIHLEKYRKVQLVDEIEHYRKQAEDIEYAFFLNSKARLSLVDLKEISSAIKNYRMISFSNHGLWRFGAVLLPDISAETLRAYTRKAFSTIQKGRLVSKSEVQKKAKEIWESVGKSVCGDYEKAWRELPVTVRMRKSVVNAYRDLKDQEEAWSKGKITLSSKDRLLINGMEIDEISEESVRRTTQIFVNRFKHAVDSAKAAECDQYVAYQVLCLIRDYPKKMGATMVAALLTGSKSQRITRNKIDRNPYYGTLKGRITQKDLVEFIKNMVSDGLLKVKHIGWHDMPVLCLPDDTKELFDNLEQPERTEAPPVKRAETVEEAVNKRDWDSLAEMADKNWAAEVALNIAAVLWPTGKAAKALKL